MTIHLRRDLMERLIEDRYDSVDRLVDEWEVRSKLSEGFRPPRIRTTIYNWLANGVSTRGSAKHQIFALCGLLDVDPMAIIDYDKNKFFKSFTAIRMSLYRMTEKSIGKGVSNFAPLIDMFMPGPSWPNATMSNLFYSREWFAEEFDNAGHEGGADYGLIKVKYADCGALPLKSSHIAYRRRHSSDKMWRYYGVVNLIDDRLELYTEGGDHHAMDCRIPGEIWFKTSFGHRPVEFRLVSLHDFTYTAEISNDMSIIGFNW